MAYFESVLYMVWSVKWDFFSYMYIYSTILAHLLNRLSFPQRTVLARLSKINWPNKCEFLSFWILYAAPLIYKFILSSVPYYKVYCLVLKSRSVNSKFVILFQNSLVILFLLSFHIKFMNHAVNFCKKSCRDLNGPLFI